MNARLYYYNAFKPNKVILIHFVLDATMNRNEKCALPTTMIENGNEYRIKNGIPITENMDETMRLYESVWDNLQNVDEYELDHIKREIASSVTVFHVNVNNDFVCRHELCYNVLQRIFCNAI